MMKEFTQMRPGHSTTVIALLAVVFGSLIQFAGTTDIRADELSEIANRTLDGLSYAQASPSELVNSSESAIEGEPNRKNVGPDPCLKNLPVPVPQAGSHRVIQLVNCSNQTILGAAN